MVAYSTFFSVVVEYTIIIWPWISPSSCNCDFIHGLLTNPMVQFFEPDRFNPIITYVGIIIHLS